MAVSPAPASSGPRPLQAERGGLHPRETSGLTSRLILSYVAERKGEPGVGQLLRMCGMQEMHEQLMDESFWFSYEDKVRMLEAARLVLEDPQAPRHIGEAAIQANVGERLQLALRAFGSPRLVYQNIARAGGKFTTTHSMTAVEIGPHSAVLRYERVRGAGFDRADCEYNIGLLSVVPSLFGAPPAKVSHPVCALRGAEHCEYRLSWETTQGRLATGILAGTGAGAALIAANAVWGGPGEIYLAGGVAPLLAGGAHLLVSRRRLARTRWARLEEHLHAQERQTRQLADSLRDLVSDLRVDDVLAKITKHAQTAVGGGQYALLLNVGGNDFSCSHTSELPEPVTEALEGWAPLAMNRTGGQPFAIDDLAAEPALAHLMADSERPVGSLAVAPLIFKGERLGMLVALADQVQGFLPRDLELLGSYAAQAAAAIANARLYEEAETEASRDPLTGLLNHREFHEKFDQETERCRRYGARLSLIMMDLDGFKRVNDTAGHREGDRVLHEIGAEIARTSRASDLPFRVGGDEFAMLCPETGPEEAELLAGRIRDAVAGRDTRVSISCGIASWPEDGSDKEEILRTADLALYAAKHGGPDRGGEGGAHRPGTGRIQRAGELERLRVGQEALRKQSRQLAVANRLGTKLSRLVDPEGICETAVRELDAEFGYLMTAITRVSEDGTEIVLVAGAGETMERLSQRGLGWRQRIDQGVMGRVVATGEAQRLDDARRDSDFLRNEINFESVSELCVPIRVGERVWGVLNLEEPVPGAFDDDDVAMANTVADQIASALQGAALYMDLEAAYLTTVEALSGALEAKDSYTASHAREIADTAVDTGALLGLDPAQLRLVRFGALLHDIGKIAVPEDILNKPGELTPEEMNLVKTHTTVGEEILSHVPFLSEVRPIVRGAHEHWDGSGYPDGLVGEASPIGARIVLVADAFHAMTSNRAYRAAMSFEEAERELRNCSGTQFDPAVVDAFLAARAQREAQPVG